MNQLRQIILAGLVLLLVAVPARQAEAQVSFGPQLVFFDFEQLGVGGRVDFGLADAFGIEDGFFQSLKGSANASYVFGDSEEFTGGSVGWDATVFNVNAVVPFVVESSVAPYAGAGINHTRYSTDFDGPDLPGFGYSGSSSGLNILGGIGFGLGALPAFAEIQYSTSGSGYLTLSGGVMFGG